MKCITYVSKVIPRKNGVMIPEKLSDIVNVSIKNNTKFNITGLLSYRKGHYIQIIEGEDSTIDHLYSNIESDPRHQQVELILNLPISSRCFLGWNFKLLESYNNDPQFLRFIDKYMDSLNLLDGNKRQLFEYFYKFKTAKLKSSQALLTQRYGGKDLKLLAWPDFTVIKDSPAIIELCARLTKQPRRYESLLASGDFGTQRQFDKILNNLEAHKMLKVADLSEQSTQIMPPGASARFYSKMKGFLGKN